MDDPEDLNIPDVSFYYIGFIMKEMFGRRAQLWVRSFIVCADLFIAGQIYLHSFIGLFSFIDAWGTETTPPEERKKFIS